MTTYKMLEKLTQIDDLTRRDHWHLESTDVCYYFGDYTARKGYAFSETNQLIFNLKKPVDRRERPEYRHKVVAFDTIANALAQAINLDAVTFVPVPPSKCASDPLFDDRLSQILSRVANRHASGIDCRTAVLQTTSMPAAHETDDRPSPDELRRNYTVDAGSFAAPFRQFTVIFDDVLTTGAHFRAVQSMLGGRVGDSQIIGVFVARRVPESIDPSDIFDEI